MTGPARVLAAVVGLAIALLGLLAARRRPAAPGAAAPVAEPLAEVPEPAPRPSGAVQAARVALIAGGAVLTGIAFGLVSIGVPARQWAGIALWLAGALVLHDAVLAPVLLVATRLLRRAHARLPWRAIAAIEVALVVGGALTLLAFPGIAAQRVGARNPSVLVFDYPAHLAIAWAVVGAAVVAAVVAGRVVRARR